MRERIPPPPGIYPSQHKPSQPAEAEVWTRLRAQLPKGWTIWHHVVHGRGIDQHEGDFIVAIPHRGVVLLECKGGRFERRDGRWYQNGQLPKQDPFDQINKFRKTFLRGLANLYPNHPEVTQALVFPDTARDDVPDDGGELILYREDLHYFAEGGAERLLKAFSGRPYRCADDGWVAALHALWGPDWRPTRAFTRNPSSADQVWRQLTGPQEAVLSCLHQSRRLVVSGGPGSGKSLLAMALADKFARSGKRVLMLTYTRAIAAEMRAAGVPDAYPIRDLAIDLGRRMGRVNATPTEVDAWQTPDWDAHVIGVAEALAADARAGRPPPAPLDADVVIVDEGQDLGDPDWKMVDQAVGERAALWVFEDEGQRTMKHAYDATPPARIQATARFELPGGHRCPPALLAFATRLRDGDRTGLEDHERRALDESLKLHRVPSDASTDARLLVLEEAIREVLALEDVTPEDVAVISLGTLRDNRVLACERLAGRPTRRADDDPEPGAIVCDTVLRVKGLERPFVFVVDLDRAHPKGHAKSTYLALTRASSRCVVVAAPGDAQAPALRALLEG